MLRLRPSSLLVIALASLAATAAPVLGQQKLLTIDELYDPAHRGRFGETGAPRTTTWLNDNEFLRTREETRDRFTTVVVDATTGSERPLLDEKVLVPALRAAAGVDEERAARVTRQRTYTFSPDKSAVVLTVADDLYYYKLGGTSVTRVTTAPGKEEEPAVSPDGRLIAYVRQSNLYVSDLSGHERPLTRDGNSRIFNGRLDWVYQEEIYGRGTYRAFWWSPDSSRLAFLRLDDTKVPDFAVLDEVPDVQNLEQTPYPRPGNPNPVVRLGVVAAAGGDITWIADSKYSSTDLLIVRVDWTPDSTQVVFQAQNREQTWLDLNLANARRGNIHTLLRETTPAWVADNGSPVWLKDGSFLWLSERNGWEHLYHYKADGSLVRQITTGEWEIRTFYGVDEDAAAAYFSATERSHIGTDIYRVRLDGSQLTRLSTAPGTHAATFNPSMSMYVGTWSDVRTPTQTRVHRSDGTALRVVDANVVPALSEYRLSTPEFLQVPTRDGFAMEAMIVKPPDFDPTRKYPVFQYTYAGPHAPQVRNAWGGTAGLYYQLLAQHGIIVWVCDNRTASGKGVVSAWPAYKRLGEIELQDIEDGLTWLKQQPWVDASRIGLSGWSYGGFMTTYALTHSTSFVMGIAGGSVTDWRNYDSIYTERYMLTPEHNPEGYQRTAPRAAAAKLSGRLLLLHGSMDDNVHVQNTVQLAYELQRAGKPFELMLYPKSRHGVTDPLLVKHMRALMLDFTLRTLVPERAPLTTGASHGTAAR